MVDDGGVPGFGDLIFDPREICMEPRFLVGGLDGVLSTKSPLLDRVGRNAVCTVFRAEPTVGNPTQEFCETHKETCTAVLSWAAIRAAGRGYVESFINSCPLQEAGHITQSSPFMTCGGAGTSPVGSLISDSSGNLYGSTINNGGSGGTVFVLQPQRNGWSLTVLCGLYGGGAGPYANLIMSVSGDLYGTTYADGEFGEGSVFKVSHSGNGWTCSTLHDFTGVSDGGLPISSVSIDG